MSAPSADATPSELGCAIFGDCLTSNRSGTVFPVQEANVTSDVTDQGSNTAQPEPHREGIVGSETVETVVQFPGQGASLDLHGNRVTILTSGSQTAGQWSVLEFSAVPHFPGPSPHWHANTTAAFYVLEGTLTLSMDGERIQAPAGSFVQIAPGTVHKYRNATANPVRFLMFLSPAGFEHYFEALSALVASEAVWPPADEGKLERLTARFDQHPPLEP
jgi:mannose-6-phosphate isomerase-like protein (cupin superfamily)